MCDEINSKKTCNKCNIVKPVEEFYKVAGGEFGYRGYCISCFRETCNDNKKSYENKIKRDYGLSAEEYNDMHDKQGGKCKICATTVGNPLRETKGDAIGVIDHCHDKGHVRGILCNTCNSGLGHFKDNPVNLMQAILYLGENGYGCNR